MTLDLSTPVNPREVQDLLQGAVSPRPIALASTVDKDGHVNLSPFSFFNVFSTRPPILVFSPARRLRDNTTKHTLENILATKEVVINIVSYAMVEQVSLASCEYGKYVNEFVKAGLTEEPAIKVRPPCVKESPVSLECHVLEVKPLGEGGGAGNLVICEVLMIHARDDIFDGQGKIDPQKIDAVARMGGNWYCRASGDAVFEVPKPVNIIGIGIDQLPESIRHSTVLTGNDLARLAGVEAIPGKEEVLEFVKRQPSNGHGSSHASERLAMVHRKAKELIELGDVHAAWLFLLSDTYASELWN